MPNAEDNLLGWSAAECQSGYPVVRQGNGGTLKHGAEIVIRFFAIHFVDTFLGHL
jgi:hypothetical protein